MGIVISKDKIIIQNCIIDTKDGEYGFVIEDGMVVGIQNCEIKTPKLITWAD